MNTTIETIAARRIWDSRGRPTVEVDVTLASGARGRGIAPAGASRGSREAVDLRDGGTALGGFGVQSALANVNGAIAQRIRGMDAMDQEALDEALISLDGTPIDKLPRAASRSGAISRATGRCACRCRRSRSSAAAPMRGGAWTCRTS